MKSDSLRILGYSVVASPFSGLAGAGLASGVLLALVEVVRARFSVREREVMASIGGVGVDVEVGAVLGRDILVPFPIW